MIDHQTVVQAIFDGIRDKDVRRDVINMYHQDAPFRHSIDVLVRWVPVWVVAMADQAEVDAKARDRLMHLLEHGVSAESVRESLERESLLPPRQTPE